MPLGRTFFVTDVAIDGVASIELRVVEDVEHLEPKLERTTFGEVGHLVQRHVEVVDAGPVEHSALGVSLSSESVRGEGVGVEQ